jgi:hypothetical protein
MPRRFLALFFVALLSLAPALAEDFTGAIVTPVAALPLRDSPPGSFFQGKGVELGTINPGEQYRVIRQTTVSTLAGSQDWIEVQSVANPAVAGWVFVGASGAPSPNVTRM